MPTTKKHANDVHALIVSLTRRRGIRRRRRRSPFVPRAAPSLRALPSIESPINPPCTTILPTCTYPRQLVTVEPISPPRPSSPTPRRVASRVFPSRVFAFASIHRHRPPSSTHLILRAVPPRARVASITRRRARVSLSERLPTVVHHRAARARLARADRTSRVAPGRAPPSVDDRETRDAGTRRGRARGRARRKPPRVWMRDRL
jgi:hypothetical protein